MSNFKKGLLLLNLGTPNSPSVPDVRAYLDEFLNDPYVIDLPYLFRKILVNGIILNTRPKKTAEAYQKVWAKTGSPLMTHSKELTEKVIQLLATGDTQVNASISVKLAMRYQTPSITQALKEFKQEEIDELVFIPLYPQYSYAASESSIVEFKKIQQQLLPQLKTTIIEDFFFHDGFIQALANSIKETVEKVKPDLLLLSYHGIPERQIAKISQCPVKCCSPGCCDQWNQDNLKCYRAQCFETSRLLGSKLNLKMEKIMTTFQSRLGRTKWIEPYTDVILKELPKKGIKRILVASPSFTADCLETLEEIKLRYAEVFMDSGGEYFEYIPCLNSREDFAQFLLQLAERN